MFHFMFTNKVSLILLVLLRARERLQAAEEWDARAAALLHPNGSASPSEPEDESPEASPSPVAAPAAISLQSGPAARGEDAGSAGMDTCEGGMFSKQDAGLAGMDTREGGKFSKQDAPAAQSGAVPAEVRGSAPTSTPAASSSRPNAAPATSPVEGVMAPADAAGEDGSVSPAAGSPSHTSGATGGAGSDPGARSACRSHPPPRRRLVNVQGESILMFPKATTWTDTTEELPDGSCCCLRCAVCGVHNGAG